MTVLHSAYGLQLAAECPLPGLSIRRIAADKEVDVWIRLKQSPASSGALPRDVHEVIYTSDHKDPQGKPVLTVGMLTGCGYFDFAYSDGARFAIEREGREVWADWPDDYTFEDAATYLMGPVLGFVLRMRGVTPLHASAVAVAGQAVALVGSAGAGKSTTAAAFARLGYRVLSDDLAPLTDGKDGLLVQPGYPRVNLWPDSVRFLFGSEDALPRVTPNWDKRFLALDQSVYHFQPEPLPLAAIYILSERKAKGEGPVFEGLEGWSALQALASNTYVNYLLDRNMRHREFEMLGRLVGHIPIRRVGPAADPANLFNLCEGIAADVMKLAKPSPFQWTSEPF